MTSPSTQTASKVFTRPRTVEIGHPTPPNNMLNRRYGGDARHRWKPSRPIQPPQRRETSPLPTIVPSAGWNIIEGPSGTHEAWRFTCIGRAWRTAGRRGTRREKPHAPRHRTCTSSCFVWGAIAIISATANENFMRRVFSASLKAHRSSPAASPTPSSALAPSRPSPLGAYLAKRTGTGQHHVGVNAHNTVGAPH